MERRRYTEAQKSWVLLQMAPPLNRTVVELARETGITTVTLRTWRRAAIENGMKIATADEGAKDWSSAQKFRAVLEAAPMSEEEVAQYCRARGILPEQLMQWRQACEQANEVSTVRPCDHSPVDAPRAVQRVKELERELRRKESALAEAAALLILRKKADAIWGKDEDE
jgi:transposase-like protein